MLSVRKLAFEGAFVVVEKVLDRPGVLACPLRAFPEASGAGQKGGSQP
jgi:hypothetical protein